MFSFSPGSHVSQVALKLYVAQDGLECLPLLLLAPLFWDSAMCYYTGLWDVCLFVLRYIQCHVAQASLELSVSPRMLTDAMTFLLLPLHCWDYRHAPPYSVDAILGLEFRAVCILGKHATN